MATKLERVGDKLTVSVGPRPNWLGLCTAFLLIFILSGAGIAPTLEGLSRALHTEQSPIGYIIGAIALFGITLFVAWNVILVLFGSELMLINPTDIEIQSRVIGIVRQRRSFPNSAVEKLRYEEWWSGARGTSMQHGIRFECAGETITFARNATKVESHDILDDMRQVYGFPAVDSSDEQSSPAVTRW